MFKISVRLELRRLAVSSLTSFNHYESFSSEINFASRNGSSQ